MGQGQLVDVWALEARTSYGTWKIEARTLYDIWEFTQMISGMFKG